MRKEKAEQNQDAGIPLIQSPEEVSNLIKDLWLTHKNGFSSPGDNVFMIKLPPLEKLNKSN